MNYSAPADRAHVQFEALMLEPLMQPLESAFGEYGEIVTQSFGEILAGELMRDAPP